METTLVSLPSTRYSRGLGVSSGRVESQMGKHIQHDMKTGVKNTVNTGLGSRLYLDDLLAWSLYENVYQPAPATLDTLGIPGSRRGGVFNVMMGVVRLPTTPKKLIRSPITHHSAELQSKGASPQA